MQFELNQVHETLAPGQGYYPSFGSSLAHCPRYRPEFAEGSLR